MRILPLVFSTITVATAACGRQEEVPLYRVRRESFRREVDAEGILRAVTSTPINVPSSTVGALTVAWIVEDGTPVREGEVIVRFDPSDIERDLQDGELALSTSERQLEQREIESAASLANLERDRGLAESELSLARQFAEKDPEIFSRVEIIESRIDERLAAEKLEHAKGRSESENALAKSDRALLAIERRVAAARVERAENALGALELRAPHDGIVVLVKDWMGNTLQPGNTTYSGRPVAELPSLGRMKAVVYVLEADAGGLKEGATATVVVEGKPGTTYPATIQQVDRMPKPRLRGIPVQYFEATLEVEGSRPEALKPGQRVRAHLVLENLEDVLVVPRQAVVDDPGGRYVYRRRRGDANLEKTAVTLGPSSLGRIVITSGLDEGDVVAARDPELSRNELAPETETGSDNGNGVGK
jgi:HlyD family secretion protein